MKATLTSGILPDGKPFASFTFDDAGNDIMPEYHYSKIFQLGNVKHTQDNNLLLKVSFLGGWLDLPANDNYDSVDFQTWIENCDDKNFDFKVNGEDFTREEITISFNFEQKR